MVYAFEHLSHIRLDGKVADTRFLVHKNFLTLTVQARFAGILMMIVECLQVRRYISCEGSCN